MAIEYYAALRLCEQKSTRCQKATQLSFPYRLQKPEDFLKAINLTFVIYFYSTYNVDM